MIQLQFDFGEFVRRPGENPDFIQPFPWPPTPRPETIHRRAINPPKDTSIYSVVGNRIELNHERYPTKRGWKTLNNLLSVYRDKRFETVRYLLVDKWGIIRDHAAVTSYATNRCKIFPDDFSGRDFVDQIKEQAGRNSYSIILIHNHPSGRTYPSEDDIAITRYLEEAFGRRFAGHVILDHGAFGLCLPGKSFETITLPVQGDDPLVKPDTKAYFGIDMVVADDEKFSILKHALQVDGIHSWNDTDWVPVFFANAAGITRALHYYGTDEFTREKASRHIVDKTIMIGRQCGAVWAFPVTGNQAMLEPLSRITRETRIFRDFYVNGTTASSLGLGGSLARHYPPDTRFAATFPVRPDVPPPERERQAAENRLADGAGNRQEEQTMEKPMPEGKELSREQHRAVVEFLDRCSTPPNDALMRDYVREITGIREFKFLEAYLPPYDNDSPDVYRDRLTEAHRRELRSYSERFPDEPYHEFTSLPILLEEGDRVTRTPLDFLASCRDIEDAPVYREAHGSETPFPHGSIRAVSPQKIALFHEGASLPLLLTDNTPANWANLYTRANDSGINVNGIIPEPEERENLGAGILSASEDRLRNAMSREWQEEEFRKDCALAQSMA
ncbi:MAG: hypothetical protein LBH57_00745, partial [Treponema sp.]|nr:hypothetical protein [Treponema sp.]